MRSRIDRWLASPAAAHRSRPIPRMALIEHFAAPAICDWMMARACVPKLVPATIYDQADRQQHGLDPGPHQQRISLYRRGNRCLCGDCEGAHRRGREATASLARRDDNSPLQCRPRISAALRFLRRHSAGLQARDVAEGGQRAVTFLLSLNDGYEGGETDFPLLGKRYRGRKGSAIFFWNIGLDSMPDKRTLHAGLPPPRKARNRLVVAMDLRRRSSELRAGSFMNLSTAPRG